jgi:hypothetical protein
MLAAADAEGCRFRLAAMPAVVRMTPKRKHSVRGI